MKGISCMVLMADENSTNLLAKHWQCQSALIASQAKSQI